MEMIEYLAIAAEVTAVLLIASIAYPPSSTRTRKQAASTETPHVPVYASEQEHASSLQTLRLLAYQTSSQSYSNLSSIQQWPNDKQQLLVGHSLREIHPLISNSPLDLVTRLPNLHELESLFMEVRTSQNRFGNHLHLVVFSVDQWAEVLKHHGSVNSELLLREAAERLSTWFSSLGLLVRFGRHQFALGLFELESDKATELVDWVRKDLNVNKFVLHEAPCELSFSVSLAELSDGDFNTEQRLTEAFWDRIDDVIVEAITAGGNQTNCSQDSDSPLRASEKSTIDHTTAAVDDSQSSETNSVSPAEIKTKTATEPTTATGGPTHAPVIPQKDVDITNPQVTEEESLVATMDDIEALFAAASKPPRLKPTDTKVPEANLMDTSNTDTSITDTSKTDIVKPDALKTEAMKSEAIKTETTKTETTTKLAAIKPAVSATEAPGDAKMSADDISSLFAAMRK